LRKGGGHLNVTLSLVCIAISFTGLSARASEPFQFGVWGSPPAIPAFNLQQSIPIILIGDSIFLGICQAKCNTVLAITAKTGTKTRNTAAGKVFVEWSVCAAQKA
jgi:hypothetical protein